ncbi:MAG: TatD family hydrolase [Clostridia bacterium]|nr:TatD family hydrolase [Clostridia bacterium]
MELFDSHAHLCDEAFDEDREEVIPKCFSSNVKFITEIGYSEETSRKAVELANKYETIFAVVGAHPDECNKDIDLSYIKELAQNKKVVAIGEIGLDYHYDNLNKENQKKYFIEQIKIANELNLPISIHSRDADMDMLEILKQNKINAGFIMHCFSSSVEVAKEIIKLDGYISISGTVTFKNAKNVVEVVKIVPENRLLIETDCPYLAPQAYRGKRNDPSYVIKTAKKVAELREKTLEEIAEITLENAKRIYRV